METIPLSRFRTTCSTVLKLVQQTKRPVLITRFGRPLALIAPPPPTTPADDWLGSLAGTGRIVGDIINPAAYESDWEVLR